MAEANKTGKQATSTQPPTKKQVEEDSDFFVVSITKKRRNVEKKMKDIKELEGRDKSTLNEDQKNKIKSKGECEERIKQYDEIIKMYNSAKKEAGVTVNKAPDAPAKKVNDKQDKTPEEILSLSRLCDFLKHDQNRDLIAWGLKVKTEDLLALSNLGASIFTLPQSSTESISALNQASLKKLNLYLSSSQEKTSDGQTYHDFHDLVTKIINSEQYNSAKISPAPVRQIVEEKKTVTPHVEVQQKPAHVETPVKPAPVVVENAPKPTPVHVEAQPQVVVETKQAPEEISQKIEVAVVKTSKLYHEDSDEEDKKQDAAPRGGNRGHRGSRKHQGGNKNQEEEEDDGFITFDRKKKFSDDGHRTRYGGKGFGSKQGQKGYSLGGRRPHYNEKPKYAEKEHYEPKRTTPNDE